MAGVIALILAVVFVIWVGRGGPKRAKSLLRQNGKKVAGLGLIAVAALMVLRGLWEPALIPAAIGWWLLTDGAMSGWLGSGFKLYLDRRFPGWREHVDAGQDPRRGNRVKTEGVMTEEEAYQILGLEPGQSSEAIGAAYRAAMKEVHPDQGGSAEMAVRLNLARDFLLKRRG